ncbi:hypothetical protein ACFYNW_10170 [Streptomyces virginiae]|uniref:hypothetical protein n=1 Tax=Streptomyces virginiae TaxID=1961 RepID=UPI0036F0DCB3
MRGADEGGDGVALAVLVRLTRLSADASPAVLGVDLVDAGVALRGDVPYALLLGSVWGAVAGGAGALPAGAGRPPIRRVTRPRARPAGRARWIPVRPRSRTGRPRPARYAGAAGAGRGGRGGAGRPGRRPRGPERAGSAAARVRRAVPGSGRLLGRDGHRRPAAPAGRSAAAETAGAAGSATVTR